MLLIIKYIRNLHTFIIYVNPRHLRHPRSFETAPTTLKTINQIS